MQQHIWSIFKFFETCGGLLCIGFHNYGFLRSAFDYGHKIYSFVFFLGTIITMISHLNMCLGTYATAFSEAILNLCLGSLFLFIALVTMYHAEEVYDVYFLQKMTSSKSVEPFKYYKAQNISAVTTSAFHFLHSMLAFDVYLSRGADEEDVLDEDITPTGPIKMYIINDTVTNWLMQHEWFQRFRGKRPSIYKSIVEQENRYE